MIWREADFEENSVIMESVKAESRESGGKMIILKENNYGVWISLRMDHLLTYPGPWDWIKSGIEPQFEVPTLEVPGPRPERIMPAARRAQAQDGGIGAARGRG